MAIRKPVQFHTHSEWFFTRMPNGDVVVSAGDGIQMVTLDRDTWESVVREMETALHDDNPSPGDQESR